MDALKAKAQTAAAAGDIDAIVAVAGEMKACRKANAEAEAKRILAENEKLSAKRTEVSGELYRIIFGTGKYKDMSTRESAKLVRQWLVETKATGFTFKLAYPDSNGVEVREHIALTVPQAPNVKTGRGGSGGPGKTKTEFGLSLDAVFQKFATDKEKAELEAEKDNSTKWDMKVLVKKAAIASGALKPLVK